MLSLAEFKMLLSREGAAHWEFQPELEFFWSFEMKSTRQQIWPYLSDTSRFNRELGFTPRTQVEKDGRLIVTTKMMGLTQRWIEEPWTWISGRTMTSTRHYLKGMAQKVYSVFHIDEDSDQGTRRVYIYFGWNPKNWFWRKFLEATGPMLHRMFTQTFLKMDQQIQSAKVTVPSSFQAAPAALDTRALKKVFEARTELLVQGQDAAVVEALIQEVIYGDDLNLEPLRILPFAAAKNLDQRKTLATCLLATRLGLLTISWDVICPHCRGSRFQARNLGEIPDAGSCAICDLDFNTSDKNSIEIMFHVHPSIRQITALLFCAAEAAKKNHIKVQIPVLAGGQFHCELPSEPGSYRFRVQGQSGEDVRVVSDGENLVVDHVNYDSVTQLLIVEQMQWDSSALRPAQVLAMPEFRDLFSEEHLSSNVKLYLGKQVILFTDIVGSTNFYTSVGDAKAFAEVKAHFQEVFAAVQTHQGVVVKTIGDAVMASFPTIDEARDAAVEIQTCFHDERSDTPIRLRVSIHSGPVIAVHLNTGIDYFGNTVNQAAKIQSCAGAGEIAMSEEVYKYLIAKRNPRFPVQLRKNSRDGAAAMDVYVAKITRLAPGQSRVA